MKRILLSLLCILLSSTVILAEGDSSVNINVEINKTESGYEVVIPQDDNYATLKPTMTVYDTAIKNAYVVKPDGNRAVAYIDNKGINFVVDMPGTFDVVQTEDKVSFADSNISSDDVKVDKLEKLDVINDSITDLLENEKSTVKTTLTEDEISVITNASNKVFVQNIVIVSNNTDSEKVKEFFKDNKDYENVSSSDIKIMVDYAADQVTGSFTVSELKEAIRITIKLPDGAKIVADNGKELKYYVLVEHEGSLSLIEAVLNDDATVSFDASKFSNYYIVYRQTDIQNSGSQNKTNETYKKPVVNTCAK